MTIASEDFRSRLMSAVPSLDSVHLRESVPAILDSIPSLKNSRAKKPHNSAKREERDFYPTPVWCVSGLMNLLSIKPGDVFLEPCIATGRIAGQFPEGHEVKWAELSKGVDYLVRDEALSADVIITNPPFSLFMEFVAASLARDLKHGGTVCYLLRLSVLGSKERADFWRLFPPTHIITISPRPSFTDGGTDNSEYAWFCWDFGNRLSTPFLWNIRKEECNG